MNTFTRRSATPRASPVKRMTDDEAASTNACATNSNYLNPFNANIDPAT